VAPSVVLHPGLQNPNFHLPGGEGPHLLSPLSGPKNPHSSLEKQKSHSFQKDLCMLTAFSLITTFHLLWSVYGGKQKGIAVIKKLKLILYK
jgi:hypothetical protein